MTEPVEIDSTLLEFALTEGLIPGARKITPQTEHTR